MAKAKLTKLEIVKNHLDSMTLDQNLKDSAPHLRTPIRLEPWDKHTERLHGAKPVVKMTVLEERLMASGRAKRWYAERCGYIACQTPTQRRKGEPGTRVSSFYDVVVGRKIPKKPGVRKKLANLLGGVPSDFWRFSDDGYLVARVVGEIDERNRPSVKRLPDIPIEEM